MKYIVIICSLIIGLFSFSCKKYDDGPFISFRSFQKRLIGTWYVTKYVEDGTEYTRNWKWTFEQADYTKDPEGSMSYVLKIPLVGPDYEEKCNGVWEAKNKKQINITFTNVTQNMGNNSQSFNPHSAALFEIQRLTKNELWVTYDTLAHHYYFEFEKE